MKNMGETRPTRQAAIVRGNSVATPNQIYQHQNSIPMRNRLLNSAKSLFTSTETEEQFSLLSERHHSNLSSCPSQSPFSAPAPAPAQDSAPAQDPASALALAQASSFESEKIQTDSGPTNSYSLSSAVNLDTKSIPPKPIETNKSVQQQQFAASGMDSSRLYQSQVTSSHVQIINVGRRHKRYHSTDQQQQQQPAQVSPSRLIANQQQQPRTSSLAGSGSGSGELLAGAPDQSTLAGSPIGGHSSARSSLSRVPSALELQLMRQSHPHPHPTHPHPNPHPHPHPHSRTPSPNQRAEQQQKLPGAGAGAGLEPSNLTSSGANSPRRRVLPMISQQPEPAGGSKPKQSAQQQPSVSPTTSSQLNCHRRLPEIPPLAAAQAQALAAVVTAQLDYHDHLHPHPHHHQHQLQQQQQQPYLRLSQSQQQPAHLLRPGFESSTKTRSFDASYTSNQASNVAGQQSSSFSLSSSNIVWPRFAGSLPIKSLSGSSSASSSSPTAFTLEQQQQQLRLQSFPVPASDKPLDQNSPAASPSGQAARHLTSSQLARANTLVSSQANSQVKQQQHHQQAPLSQFNYVDKKQQQQLQLTANADVTLTRASSLITSDAAQEQQPGLTRLDKRIGVLGHRLTSNSSASSSSGSASGSGSGSASGSSSSPAAPLTSSPPQTANLAMAGNQRQRNQRIISPNVGQQQPNLYFTFESTTITPNNDTIKTDGQHHHYNHYQQQQQQQMAICSLLRADEASQMTSLTGSSAKQFAADTPSAVNQPDSPVDTGTLTARTSSVRGRRLSSCGSDLRANFLMNKQHAISDLTPPRSLESSGSSDQQPAWPTRPEPDRTGRPATPTVFGARPEPRESRQASLSPHQSSAGSGPDRSGGSGPEVGAQRRTSSYTVACAPAVFVGMHAGGEPARPGQQGAPAEAYLERLHQYQYQYQSGRRPSGTLAGLPPRAASASESTGTNKHVPPPLTTMGAPLWASSPKGGQVQSISASQSSGVHQSGGSANWPAASRHRQPTGHFAGYEPSSLEARAWAAAEPTLAGAPGELGRRLVPYSMGMTNALSVDVYESAPVPAQAQAQAQAPAPASHERLDIADGALSALGSSYLLKRASTLIPPAGQRDRQPSNVSSASMPAASQLQVSASISPQLSPAIIGAGQSPFQHQPRARFGVWAERMAGAQSACSQQLAGAASSYAGGRRACSAGQLESGAISSNPMPSSSSSLSASSPTSLSRGGSARRPPANSFGSDELISSSRSSSSTSSRGDVASGSGSSGSNSSGSGQVSSASSGSRREEPGELDQLALDDGGHRRQVIRVCDRKGGGLNWRRKAKCRPANQERRAHLEVATKRQKSPIDKRANEGQQTRGPGAELDLGRLTLDDKLRLAERSANELFRKVDLSPARRQQQIKGSSQSSGGQALADPVVSRGQSGQLADAWRPSCPRQQTSAGTQAGRQNKGAWPGQVSGPTTGTGGRSSRWSARARTLGGSSEANCEHDNIPAHHGLPAPTWSGQRRPELELDGAEHEADDLSLFLRSLDKQRQLEQRQSQQSAIEDGPTAARCNKGSESPGGPKQATTGHDLAAQKSGSHRRRLKLALGASFRLKSNNNNRDSSLFAELERTSGSNGAATVPAAGDEISSGTVGGASIRHRAAKVVRRAMTLKSLVRGLSSQRASTCEPSLAQVQLQVQVQARLEPVAANSNQRRAASLRGSHLLMAASAEATDQLRRISAQEGCAGDERDRSLLSRRVIDSLMAFYHRGSGSGSGAGHTCSPIVHQ